MKNKTFLFRKTWNFWTMFFKILNFDMNSNINKINIFDECWDVYFIYINLEIQIIK